ncbi:MAG: Lrp/AsnC ligand binding domain-containing protein [Candidatus Methanofastidiosia archaeon]
MSFVSKCFDDVHEIVGMKVKPGYEDNILKELKKRKEVAAVFTSLGDYDIMVFLKIEDPKKATVFVNEHIRNIPGVLDTKTTLIKK